VYSWTQATLTGAGVVASGLLLVAGITVPALVLGAVLAALALRDSTGMPAWRRVGRGVRYLAAWAGGRLVWEAGGKTPAPRLLAGVEVAGLELPAGVMGLVVDRGRYLAGMRVSPTRDPWLQSRGDRDVAADDWARVVASLPVEHVDRLQVLTVARQGGGEDLIADAATATGPGADVLREVAAVLAAHVRHTETVLVVRLAAKAGHDTARRGGTDAVGRLLHATLQQIGGLFPPEGLHAEILAPADWEDLLDRVLHLEPGQPRPERVEERWGTVSVDGTVHRLLWMWQWPLRPMAAGFLAPLLTGAGNRVTSLLVAPADPEPYGRSLDWAYRRAESAVATARGSRHRKQAELDSLDRQLGELTEGHVPVRALVTVAVSAPDRSGVEDLTGLARSSAVAGSCRLAVLGGDQGRALGWVLPLCRGLDPGVDP